MLFNIFPLIARKHNTSRIYVCVVCRTVDLNISKITRRTMRPKLSENSFHTLFPHGDSLCVTSRHNNKKKKRKEKAIRHGGTISSSSKDKETRRGMRRKEIGRTLVLSLGRETPENLLSFSVEAARRERLQKNRALRKGIRTKIQAY